jgi:transcriptional regulator with XRE-family HTH domain
LAASHPASRAANRLATCHRVGRAPRAPTAIARSPIRRPVGYPLGHAMPAASAGPGDHLADNIKALRLARGLSQQQIARAAGVPRATWTHLESGAGNPTLAVLVKIAGALQVRLDELLAAPSPPARHIAAAELPVRQRGEVTVRKLLPESLPGLDLERMVLPPGARMTGVPHTPGTREYLTCERGTVELAVAGERYRLAEGDVVTFRGDQRHGYHNPGAQVAVAYSAIAFAPLTA